MDTFNGFIRWPVKADRIEKDYYIDHKIDKDIYKKTIFDSKYDLEPAYLVLRCKFYSVEKEYSLSIKESDKVISMINKKNFGKENYLESNSAINIHYILHKLYQYTAQANANLGNDQKAINCYKLSQYYSIQLNSEFDNRENVILYSFRPVSTYALSDIAKNVITVCNPKVMNDPFDSLFQHWATKENFENICEDKTHINTLIDSYKYFKIRSFVGNKKQAKDNSILRNSTMWSHYAQNHKGFCIRYKFSKDMIKRRYDGTTTHWFLKKVIYKKDNETVDLAIKRTDTNLLFATKSNQWKYENEIRLISYDPNNENDFSQIALDPESCIEAIYFGYRCSESDITLIKKILAEQKGIKYYKIEKNLSDIYRLRIKNI